MDRKVLIIDDEPQNVEALMDYLDRCNVPHDYSQTLVGAARRLRWSLSEGRLYDLVISDNHFKEEVEGIPNFNGSDLVKILMGFDLDEEQTHFASVHFGQLYDYLVETYSDRVMIFSGSAGSEPELEGITAIQKVPDADGECCEAGVIRAMRAKTC